MNHNWPVDYHWWATGGGSVDLSSPTGNYFKEHFFGGENTIKS